MSIIILHEKISNSANRHIYIPSISLLNQVCYQENKIYLSKLELLLLKTFWKRNRTILREEGSWKANKFKRIYLKLPQQFSTSAVQPLFRPLTRLTVVRVQGSVLDRFTTPLEKISFIFPIRIFHIIPTCTAEWNFQGEQRRTRRKRTYTRYRFFFLPRPFFFFFFARANHCGRHRCDIPSTIPTYIRRLVWKINGNNYDDDDKKLIR